MVPATGTTSIQAAESSSKADGASRMTMPQNVYVSDVGSPYLPAQAARDRARRRELEMRRALALLESGRADECAVALRRALAT